MVVVTVEETRKKKKQRRVSLVWGFVAGVVTCSTLSLEYYGSGGCGRAREAGRIDTRQVSDLMCCVVGKWIAGVGLVLTSLLVLAGLATTPDLAQSLGATLGECCCGACTRGAGGPLVTAMTISAIGNMILAIFNLCWLPIPHLIGALFFFGGGYVALGILCFSRRQKLALFSLADDQFLAFLKPTILVLAGAAIPITAADPLTAEWCAIVAIGLAVLAVEFDHRRGTALLNSSRGSDDVMTTQSGGDLFPLREALYDPSRP